MQNIIDRFISYVTIDTTSDPESNTTPSTEKQWALAKKLEDDCFRPSSRASVVKSFIMGAISVSAISQAIPPPIVPAPSAAPLFNF